MSLDIDFVCRFCSWTGTEPQFDAHLNTFCPDCGKPATFADHEMAKRRLRELAEGEESRE